MTHEQVAVEALVRDDVTLARLTPARFLQRAARTARPRQEGWRREGRRSECGSAEATGRLLVAHVEAGDVTVATERSALRT